MRNIILTKKIANKEKRNSKKIMSASEKSGYINFLMKSLQLNLTFLQISNLGKHLNLLASKEDLNFFKYLFFDYEEVSKVSNLLGNYFLAQLRQELEISPYSMSLDSATIDGKSYAALKVRYIQFGKDQKEAMIINKIAGIYELGETSCAKTLLKLVKENLFDISEKIKLNFIGFVHDGAAVLSGDINGLSTLLRKEIPNFFDLKDPCHILALILDYSLKKLPNEIMEFVNNTLNHLMYPQRKAKLVKYQDENNFKILRPKSYTNSRWLSLGDSLHRMIEIWESLQEAAEILEFKPDIIEKLNDNNFKLKIICLNGLISKLNGINRVFQSSTLESVRLKDLLHDHINWFLGRVIKLNSLRDKLNQFDSIKWNNLENQIEYLNSNDEILEQLGNHLDSRLMNIEQHNKEEFIQTFKPFILEIIDQTYDRFNYRDPDIESLDVLRFPADRFEYQMKVMKINKSLKIIKNEELKQFSEEIEEYCNLNFLQFFKNGILTSLELWDLIRNSFPNRFSLLNKFFHVLHSLPTSSANIEQSFFVAKLIKALTRHNLKSNTLLNLILIWQESKNMGEFKIPETIVKEYDSLIQELTDRKNKVIEFNPEPETTQSYK